MKCLKCGNDNNENINFCIYCGNYLGMNPNYNDNGNKYEVECVYVLKTKPSYVKIIFKSIGISFLSCLTIYMIPYFLSVFSGPVWSIKKYKNMSIYHMISRIESFEPVLILFILIPVIIVINCLRANKK